MWSALEEREDPFAMMGGMGNGQGFEVALLEGCPNAVAVWADAGCRVCSCWPCARVGGLAEEQEVVRLRKENCNLNKELRGLKVGNPSM